MTLKAGMVVTIVGTGEVGVLMQVRESSQTCVIKLNNGTLKKSVPLDDVEEASDKKAPNEIKSPIRLQADTTTAFALPSKAGAYEVGQDVLARFKRSTKYFPGKITKARANGTYDIEYEDGDVETSVDPSMIMPALAKPKSPKKQVAATWEVGDAVQARYKGGKKLYSGKVTKAHADGTYDIKYEDGDVETRVHPSLIEAIEDVGHKQKSKGLVVGAAVQARYKGGKKLYRGNIQKVHSDGTYDVKYEDGDVETRVEAAMIELVEEAEATESPKKTKNKAFKVGESVQARYHGGKRIYSGKITRAHADGTYDIKYDDGEVESRIDAALIEGSASPSAANDKSKRVYEVGDVVQARYKGGKKLYKGKITRVHSDGSYDIKYEDGDVETRVDQEMIASSDSDGATSPKHDTMLQVGDAVQAPFKGGKKLYSGTIAKRHSDNTYDVRFDDGDTETRVPFALIVRSEPVSKPPKSKTKKTPSVGTVVQARYKGGKKLYKGKITRARLDGTFDIQYEDGDVEQRVGADMIVLPDDGSDDEADGGGKQTAASPKKTKKKHLDVGDPVQAHYKGGKKLYGGKIMRVHSDGTYDVKYDDGDVETRVPLDMIEVSEDASDTEAAKKKGKKRKLEVGLAVQARYKAMIDASDDEEEATSTSKPSKPKSLAVGDAVQAKYKGGKKLYSGKITRVHADGTYDIKYEDGDVETRVSKANIVAPEDAAAPSGSPTKSQQRRVLAVGDIVQARYKGGKKLYKGEIKRVRSDGTYDIEYEDGDVETRVDPAMITADDNVGQDSDMEASSKKRISAGDAVQARYKGGKKLYHGKVLRVHSDGTLDIQYEDGDVERRVDPAMVVDNSAKSESKRSPTVGETVQARYKGGKKLYPGKVIRAHSDGTFDIQYEDGDVEKRVKASNIVVAGDNDGDNGATSPKKTKRLEVGTVVHARYKGGKKLYRGKVTRAHSDGTYDIKYENGDVETHVGADMIDSDDLKPAATSPKSNGKPKPPSVGTVVQARYKGGKKLYKGKITRARLDGTFDIQYEDGDVEQRVGADMIVLPDDGSDDEADGGGKQTAASPKKTKKKHLDVGDPVQAHYKGGKKLYGGKIMRVHSDGTYDVKYDDGDVETRVPLDMIEVSEDASDTEAAKKKGKKRKLEVGLAVQARYKAMIDASDDEEEATSTSKPSKPKSLAVGDAVQAKYKGGKKLYSGKITRVHADGTYDIKYEDGDVETRVSKANIVAPEDAAAPSGSPTKSQQRRVLAVGDIVQARYKGGKKLYKGEIKRVRSDGTYDIEYEDGDVETRVDPAMITADDNVGQDSDMEASSKKRISAGDAVQARYKGGKKLYHGKVLRVHSDGTLDIQYEDGDVERRVDPAMVVDNSAKSESKRSPTVGETVQARYKGGKKLYPGKVIRAHSDGTFDIQYEDGDVEKRVEALMIVGQKETESEEKGTGSSAAEKKSAKKRSISVGDTVQARYKGGKKLYRGEVIKVHSDNSYDIRYDDGDIEKRVESTMIAEPVDSDAESEAKTGDKAAKKQKKLSVGRTVQVRLKGGKKLYSAKVVKVHSDGTYAVEFDDGDIEKRVGADMIIDDDESDSEEDAKPQAPDNAESKDHSGAKKPHAVGSIVQVNRDGGKSRSRGKITRVRADDTFDIRYDDGETEKRIPRKLIHADRESDNDSDNEAKFSSPKHTKTKSLAVESVVQARYKGGKTHYRGKIVRVRSDGSYDIRFDDGDVEEGVNPTFVVVASSDDATRDKSELVGWSGELQPVAFVAAVMFSQDMILRFKDAFESFVEENDYLIPTARLESFVAKVTEHPTKLRSAISSLQKRAASVSLAEVFAVCGFLIDELASVPTIQNAVAKLRIRLDAGEVRRVITLVRNVCLKVLRFPNNSDYWRLRADSPAFLAKLGRVEGATALLEACGFSEYNHVYYELRGVRTSSGKRISALSKHTLDQLRENCALLESELSSMDGVDSVLSVITRISKEREAEVPLSIEECRHVLRNVLTYVENILKNPKDSRCWRIREANKVYQRQVGYLPFATDLMDCIGFERVSTSQGFVLALKGTWVAGPDAKDKTASLSNFSFSRISERSEWFLWRRKQEIETLLEDDMSYLAELLPTSSVWASSLKPRQSDRNATMITRMYPYGRNVMDLFSKTSVQRAQLDMIRMVFAEMDCDKKEFLDGDDFHRSVPNNDLPVWAKFDAYDIDHDGKIDFTDFVAAFGPCLDHSFDVGNAIDIVPFEKMSLCERVSAHIGQLRLRTGITEALYVLERIAQQGCQLITNANKTDLWKIKAKSELGQQLHKHHAAKELLLLFGFREVDMSTNQQLGSEKEFVLRTQSVRFNTSKDHPSMPQSLDNATAWIKLTELAVLCVNNVLTHPQSERYRVLTTSSHAFTSIAGSVRGGVELLLSIGFRETDRGALALPFDTVIEQLKARKLELEAGLWLLRAQDFQVADELDGADIAAVHSAQKNEQSHSHHSTIRAESLHLSLGLATQAGADTIMVKRSNALERGCVIRIGSECNDLVEERTVVNVKDSHTLPNLAAVELDSQLSYFHPVKELAFIKSILPSNVTRSLHMADLRFGRFDNENYLVGYEELIDMLRLREIIHEPPSKTCVNDPMQLAVLKQAFQHLQSQPSNGWKTVHLKSLITSAKTTLQQQMAVSRLNDADQAISDDNMLEKMQTVVKKIEVTWPEIEYVLRTKNPFTSVISIPVQSFSDAHATLNDAALEIGLLNQHTAFRMVPVEESSKQGVFQVILQRASIARVGFFVCAYVQDGIFSDRSMNEIVAAFRSQQLMLKPKSAFEKFAQVYQENVDMQLLMFFTKDDGDGYQRSGIDDCMQSREIQPPLVLGTLLTPVQSANPEGKLSFWSIQRAQVEIGKRASCSANDAPAPSSEDIKQCVAWQSSTLLDAARVQMMRCGVDEDLEATIATEERFQIIRNVKAEMFRLVGSSTSQPEIANALLVLLQQFCLNGSRNRFICKTIDPFFRRIFDGCAKMTDTCSETSNSKLVPQDEFVASLQMNQERNVFYREWIAHVISLLNATTRRPDLAVAWKDVALVLRQINISFLRVEECADILVDLGLAGSSENRFPRLPALVHELLDALQCSRVESGVLVALPELVELLIKTNAFSSFFHTQWQALQTITEAAHAQHNDTFTVDNTYALYALCDHLNVSVNDSLSRLGDFQYRLEVHAADRTLKVAAPSINKLRALLKTPLPDIPVPVFTSLTLQTRSKTLRISDCVVFNALGVSGNAQPASNLTVIQSLLLNQPAPWDANILRFHQRIARVRAREYFLPILFSALDSPILLAGRGIDSAVSKATGLVTTSIDGWMSLADVVKHGSAALTTTGWTRLGYGWLYQVLLAMITIQNERFVLEQLRLEDILLSPDARAVRVSVVRGLRSVGEDESHDFVAQTRSYGLVAMRFLELVLAHGDDSHTFEQTLMVDALDDQLAQLHRRSAIQALKGFVQNGLEIQLDEYSSIAEVMAADIPCECMELVRLVKLILMALQPMPRACRLDVLWELVYDSAQIQVPDELTVDLMPHVRVQQALELQVLDPIERLVQLMATPRYQHCEGQRARLRTMSASLASLLAVWNDSIDKHLVSKPDDIGSQAISSVFLERVVAAKVVLKVAHAARALTVCLVHCDGVRACHTIVQQLLASLDHLLKSLNLVSLRAVIQRNWNVVALILQVLTAVGEFVTSQPSDIESDVTMTVPGSMTAVNGLWRLAEASLQRVLKSSDGAVDELCHLQAIMKKYAALPWHAFQARYEVRQSRLLTSHTARPSLLFWWTDSAPVMPRRVKPAIPTRLRSWCTDHSHLSTANRTFDIYFRLMCGIKVPKFRRAVVHEWFAPCFLERKVFAPLILPREPVATTWLIVRFDRLVLSLIHDPDEVVLLGAVSLLDILTRVLRFAPQRATRRPLPAVLVPAESTDARHILGCSAAQQLALQVGSEHVLVAVVCVLRRVVRALKLLGSSGVTERKGDRPHPLVATFWAICAYVVNCLHGGDRLTRCWSRAGLLHLILAHAKSNALTFLKPIDGNAIHELSQRHRHSHSRRGEAPWVAFTSFAPHDVATNASPFRLLMLEIMAVGSGSSVVMMKHLVNTSKFFRKEANLAASASSELLLRPLSLASAVDLCLHKSYGKVSHAFDLAAELESFDGSASEVEQLVKYATSIMELRKAMHPRDPISPLFHRLANKIWRWMKKNWQLAVLHGNASVHGRIVVAALRLLHAIVACESIESDERLSLMRWDDIRFPVGAGEEESAQESPTSCLTLVLNLVSSVVVESPEVTGATSENDQHIAISCVFELFARIAEMVVDRRELHLVVVDERTLDAALRVLRVSCRVDGGHVSYSLHHKWQLWVCLLRCASRHLAAAVVQNNFIGSHVFALLKADRTGGDVDISNENIVERRTEAIMLLESLVDEEHRLEVNNAAPDASVGIHVLREEAAKQALFHRTLPRERSLVSSCVTDRIGGQSASGIIATAVRVTQLLCCLAFDVASNALDPAFQADLESADVPAWVVEFHQRTVARDEDELAAVERRVQLFWKEWSVSSSPKPSTGGSDNVQIKTKDSVRGRARLLDNQRTARVPTRPQPPLATGLAILTSPSSVEVGRTSLNKLLAVLGDEVVNLERAFRTFAVGDDTNVNSAQLEEACLAPALAQLAVQAPVSLARKRSFGFRDFVKIYAQASGLEAAMAAQQQAHPTVPVRWIRASNGKWCCITSDEEAKLRICGEHTETSNAVDTEFAVRTLKNALGTIALAEVRTRVNALVRIDGKVSFDDVCRVFLKLQSDPRAKSALRLTLQGEDATTGERVKKRPAIEAILSPVQTKGTVKEASRAEKAGGAVNSDHVKRQDPMRQSTLDALLRVDVDSANVLSRVPRCVDDAASESMDSTAYAPASAQDESSSSSSDASSSESSQSTLPPRSRKSSAKPKPRRTKSAKATKRVQGSLSSDSSNNSSSDESKSVGAASSSSSQSSSTKRRRRKETQKRITSPRRSKGGGKTTRKPPNSEQKQRKTPRVVGLAQPTSETRLSPSEVLRVVFDRYDVDGDGVISFADLRRALHSGRKRLHVTDVEIQQWIAQKDRQGQGHVTFEDFVCEFQAKAQAQPAKSVAQAPAEGQRKTLMSTKRR
ncbi:TPA: hypothetical protein N0F65_000491 [Lagenidium giganteum]|uniref:EF-hand domain-containing protein n=1 Tax=Lagenidium giganteum TaxID=4803 RepID=A0AAV2Z053_9STRA|nr:TPA: hypothetical protein N0F65_000491 [Lagenidium giganteum]